MSLAQTSSGILAGTVSDPSGAAVANATVTVVSQDTGEKRVIQTNSSGGYRVEALTPGTWTVSAEATGFRKATTTGVHVSASEPTSVNEQLSLGTQETVEVSTDVAVLDTETGAMSGTLSSIAVDNLPVQGLNPYYLALTLPGVTVSGAQSVLSNGVSFSVNGGRPRANNFLIEGTDNNDAGIHGQGLQPENLDAIEQVVVLENSYQAEFGGGGGSVSNLIYKNGSNVFHGAVWDRIENSSLDAADKANFFNGGFKSKSRENIFGYDIGGFAIKDRLFFFNSLQFDHYRSSTSSTLVVPTADGITQLMSLPSNTQITNLLGAIGALQGQSNPTTGKADVACEQLSSTDMTPATASCPAGTVGVGPAIRSVPLDSNGPELDNKVEYIVNPKDTLNFRYIRTTFNAPIDGFNYPNQLPGFDATQYGQSHNAGITETHIFSPRLLNELRLSYGRIGFIFDFAPSTYANPLGRLPTTSIGGIQGFGAPSGDPQSRQHNTYQIQDALNWNIGGRHAIKVGFDVSDVRVRDAVPYNYYGSLSYNASQGISALGNYIDDYSGPSGSAAITYGNPVVRPQMYSQNYYIQDAWKASENLTVEMGFRYEYQGTPFNSLPYPAFDITNANCTNPTVNGGVPSFCKVLEQPDRGLYGPRIGFSYSPAFLQKKTVVRGGFGMFYDGLFTNIIDNTDATSPNSASKSIIAGSSLSSRHIANLSQYLTPGVFSTTPAITDTIESMSPTIRSPRTLQFNLNVEQDLGHGFISQIGYVGTRGEHLFAGTESNPQNPFTGSRLFPNAGRIIIRDNSGDSAYHSAQVQINRSFTHGFLMRASYTWSKFLDDTSEIFTVGNFSQYAEIQYPYPRKLIDWGPSALDTRHRLAISYVYAPPAWHPEGYLKAAAAIVNGFQFSGVEQFTSGEPGNVEVGYDANGDGISNDRPKLSNPGAPLASYAFDRASFYDGNAGLCDGPTLWYIGNCTPVTASQVRFQVLPYGVNGDYLNGSVLQRNSFHTLGNQSSDVSVQRTFHIHDRQNFDLRAEAFNVFNQGTTGIPALSLTGDIYPDPSFGTTTFGDFSQTLAGHRNLRFYAKYSF